MESIGFTFIQVSKGMAAHSSTLARRTPMDRGAWRAAAHGCKESDTTEWAQIKRKQPSGLVLLTVRIMQSFLLVATNSASFFRMISGNPLFVRLLKHGAWEA